jgi:hypothetical protein
MVELMSQCAYISLSHLMEPVILTVSGVTVDSLVLMSKVVRRKVAVGVQLILTLVTFPGVITNLPLHLIMLFKMYRKLLWELK